MEEKNHSAKEESIEIKGNGTSPDIPSTQDIEETSHSREVVKPKETCKNESTPDSTGTTIAGAIDGHILSGKACATGYGALVGGLLGGPLGAVVGAGLGCARIVAAASLNDIEEEASSSYSNKKE